MVLRWVVGNWIRAAAKEKLYETVAEAARETMGKSNETPPTDGPDQPSTTETKECDVGLIFALWAESGGLVERLSDKTTTRGANFIEHRGRIGERRVAIVESGVGGKAAARATEDLISVRHPQWIVSAGFAGGLNDKLRQGDILMADRLVDSDGKELKIDLKMDADVLAATPRLHVGTLLTVDRIVRKPEEKRALGHKHHALGVDLETMAVARVCRRETTRFLCVRVISDAVDEELPPDVEHLMDQDTTAARLGAVTGAIFRRPSSVKDMWKLKEDALVNSESLAKFLLGVVSQLVPETTQITRQSQSE